MKTAYEISRNNDILTFSKDHGDCYGNVHSTHIDCWGLKGTDLYNHIKEHAGKRMAIDALEQGFL